MPSEYRDLYPDFDILEGRTLASVTQDGEQVVFQCDNGEMFSLYHVPDCCESVDLIDIAGDLGDLVGEVLGAEESTNSDIQPHEEGYRPESYTWTFYRIWTIRGTVVLRWYGTSNGYYCETPTFRRVEGATA